MFFINKLFLFFLFSFLIPAVTQYALGQPTKSNLQLQEALINNNLRDVQMAIDAGADVNAPDSSGDRPLMYAALYSSIDCMKLLLDDHANPNEKNNAGETALMCCTQDFDKVKLLINRKHFIF